MNDFLQGVWIHIMHEGLCLFAVCRYRRDNLPFLTCVHHSVCIVAGAMRALRHLRNKKVVKVGLFSVSISGFQSDFHGIQNSHAESL